MEQVLKIAIQGGWPLAIIGFVGAIVNYWIASQIGKSREELRTLRVAMEHAATPEHIRKCVAMWPDLSQYPATVQQGEMVKRATIEEGKRAQRKEMAMTYTRYCVFVAVIGIALIATGYFWKPG